MTEYIAAIVYPEKSKTYEAFSKISAGSERLGVVSAVLVECDADGRLTIPEGEDGHAGLGLGTGSLIGVLVGALGGPIGMLLGLGVGAATGAAVDVSRAEVGELAVSTFANLMTPGSNAIIAQTDEDGSTAPLDAAVAELGGSIVRRPLDEVLAELEAQNAAAEEAAEAARRAMREEKRQERKENRERRIEALREKFSRH